MLLLEAIIIRLFIFMIEVFKLCILKIKSSLKALLAEVVKRDFFPKRLVNEKEVKVL